MNRHLIRMGEIAAPGERPRKVEILPAREPVRTPQPEPVRVPEKVPA